jgi:hypothetical protein
MILTQLVKMVPAFIEDNGSSDFIQNGTRPYPEPVQTGPHLHTVVSERFVLVTSAHLCPGLQSVSSVQVFRLKLFTYSSSLRACYMSRLPHPP